MTALIYRNLSNSFLMCRIVFALACLTRATSGRRVQFPEDRGTRHLHEEKSRTLLGNSTGKELRWGLPSAKPSPSPSRHDQFRSFSSLLFFRRRNPPPSVWQNAGHALANAATSISTSIGNGVVEHMDRKARQRRLRRASHEVLLLSLLAARLSEIVYLNSQEELEKELESPAYDDIPSGLKILHFYRQGQNKENEIAPQWFLARGDLPSWGTLDDGDIDEGGGEALYLVFRGTWSATDAMRDACIEPERERNGCFHGGFLQAVRDNPELHTHLRRAMRRGCKHLYVFGHSLGGSIAMTLVAAGLLPSWYTGDVTAVGIGATAMVATAHCDQVKDVSRPPARYVLVVNDCDVVPRLLGSPMPVSTSKMLASIATDAASEAVLQRNVEIMETMQQYAHPEGVETVLLKDGRAKSVPASELPTVLHLGESMSPNLFEHHRTANYVSELEIASTLAEVFGDESRRGFRRFRKRKAPQGGRFKLLTWAPGR